MQWGAWCKSPSGAYARLSTLQCGDMELSLGTISHTWPCHSSSHQSSWWTSSPGEPATNTEWWGQGHCRVKRGGKKMSKWWMDILYEKVCICIHIKCYIQFSLQVVTTAQVCLLLLLSILDHQRGFATYQSLQSKKADAVTSLIKDQVGLIVTVNFQQNVINCCSVSINMHVVCSTLQVRLLSSRMFLAARSRWINPLFER